MLDALKNARLKKVDVVDLPKPVKELDVSEIQNKSLDVNIECWYEQLKYCTFPTTFFSLSQADVRFFIEAYTELVLRKKTSLPPELEIHSQNLIGALTKVIDDVRDGGDCVFVKTSCRSAKDTTIYALQFRELYKTFLQKKDSPTTNNKVIALLEAGTNALKTYSAQNLFSTFLISERVHGDFELALARPERWNQNLAVRKWIPMDVDMEFRGFVKNNQLNAISQYNYVAYFPRLVTLKSQLLQTIINFFENTCKPALQEKFSEYIIDFGITGEKFDKIWVIELNEFMDTTDGCMFNWARERPILENGPLVFRLVEEEIPVDKQRATLGLEWLALVDAQ